MKVERAFLALFFLVFFAGSAFAAVGETYDQMAGRYGAPAPVSLSRAVRAKEVSRYSAAGAKAYLFQVSGFNVYAVFNGNNVCFKMFTRHNRTLPPPAALIGPLANTKPIVLWREPRRAIKLQYGSGGNAVIYTTFGLPGDLNAEAYSMALAP